jgi:hypothetical protein
MQWSIYINSSGLSPADVMLAGMSTRNTSFCKKVRGYAAVELAASVSVYVTITQRLNVDRNRVYESPRHSLRFCTSNISD